MSLSLVQWENLLSLLQKAMLADLIILNNTYLFMLGLSYDLWDL